MVDRFPGPACLDNEGRHNAGRQDTALPAGGIVINNTAKMPGNVVSLGLAAGPKERERHVYVRKVAPVAHSAYGRINNVELAQKVKRFVFCTFVARRFDVNNVHRILRALRCVRDCRICGYRIR